MITFAQLGKQGRYGNQMFQAAAVIALAKRTNDDYILPFCDLTPTTNIPYEKFSNKIEFNYTYVEPFFHYKEITHNKWEILNLSGYFQSYLYFDDYKDEIIDLMTPNFHFERENDLCSIHVRRTDYLRFPNHHPVQTMSYYEKAMELSGCSRFVIFSDDMLWCKDNFKGNKFEFSDNRDPVIDLAMMIKKCHSNIICNSSFSYWGAFLNKNPNKKIISPQKWFGPALQHNTNDLMPKEWIKI